MLQIDAEALYADMRSGVRALLQPGSVLVGIWSGGAWLAERLQRDLALPGGERGYGVISSTLHRDDFSSRGLATAHKTGKESGSDATRLGGSDVTRLGGSDVTRLPFQIAGQHIVLVDDVLYTGRTIRAVVNELFDFGRPASVRLAVLVDRGGRELPMAAAFSAARISLPATQRLSLLQAQNGRLHFDLRGPDLRAEAPRGTDLR